MTERREQSVLDAIDELVDEQLARHEQRSSYDEDVNQPTCWHCGEDAHALPIKQRMQEIRWLWRSSIRYYENEQRVSPEVAAELDAYRYDEDTSPVLCPGSDFIGPVATPQQIEWAQEDISSGVVFLRSSTDSELAAYQSVNQQILETMLAALGMDSVVSELIGQPFLAGTATVHIVSSEPGRTILGQSISDTYLDEVNRNLNAAIYRDIAGLQARLSESVNAITPGINEAFRQVGVAVQSIVPALRELTELLGGGSGPSDTSRGRRAPRNAQPMWTNDFSRRGRGRRSR